MEKIMEIGRVKGSACGYSENYRGSLNCTLEISLKEQKGQLRLSICGNIWNRNLTDVIQCGQMQDTLRELLKKHEFSKLNVSKEDFVRLLNIWDRWHLNDMRAGCEHQRELLKKNPLWSRKYEDLKVRPEFKKCSSCGYSYGSKWLYEPLPSEVVEFVKGFGV